MADYNIGSYTVGNGGTSNTMIDISAGFMSMDKAYEIQRTNNFFIVIPLYSNGAFNADATKTVALACETSGLPNSTTDPIEAPYGNSQVKVAGKTTFDDVSITVKDFIEKDIELLLMQWRYQVYNPETGQIGWAVNYKRQCSIVLYGPNGSRVRSWTAKGVWPTNLELGDLDYSSADLRKLTMSLSVDEAYPDVRRASENRYDTGKMPAAIK